MPRSKSPLAALAFVLLSTFAGGSCFNSQTNSNAELALLCAPNVKNLVPRFVFVASRQVAPLSAFSIDPVTGFLSQIT